MYKKIKAIVSIVFVASIISSCSVEYRQRHRPPPPPPVEEKVIIKP